MSGAPTPVLEPRRRADFVAALLGRIPGYVPGWRPPARGPGTAVAQVYARFLETLADRINQGPDKHRLAFYDLLGLELLAAVPARVPVLFEPLPMVGDSRVPARTRVGAKVEGRDEPIVFETERDIALAAAPLVQVVSVWPGRDQYADHSVAALRGEPFTLFEGLQPTRHELYLAHDTHFALAGRSTVELVLELERGGSEPLDLAWEYWDGELWRGFKDFVPGSLDMADSVDGTAGLTRTGTIRLVSDCAWTEATVVAGAGALWLRARLRAPLPPDSLVKLPEVERIQVRSVIDRTLPTDVCTALEEGAGIVPEQAFGGEVKLDLSRTVQPLGASPRLGSSLLLACDEALSKPGARVTLCFTRVETPEENVDQQGAQFETDVAAAQRLVLEAALESARAISESCENVRTLIPTFLGPGNAFIQSLADALNSAIADAAGALAAAEAMVPPGGVDLELIEPMLETGRAFADQVMIYIPRLISPASAPVSLTSSSQATLAANMVFNPVGMAVGVIDLVAENDQRLELADDRVDDAIRASEAALAALDNLTPIDAAMAGSAELPTLSAPTVAWEYWNGRRWAALPLVTTGRALTFEADGPVVFDVPEDAEIREQQGVTARWVRARLVAGGYGTVRTVSWRDEASGRLNFFPIIQVRPPAIAGVQLGYLYRSSTGAPERCLTLNDFQYRDVGGEARTAGTSFAPFAPVADRTPTLYLGFDGPLPADLLSLYVEVEEVIGETEGPALDWDYWDGSAWLPLRVADGTAGLALPGMVEVLYPGVPPLPRARLLEASGRALRLESPREAGRFASGDLLHLTRGAEGELARVAVVEGDTITLEYPLTGEYGNGDVAIASLPRFGEPRTWVRARLASDGSPRASVVNAIHPNTAWAAQVQTFEGETLGTGTGQPGQVFFIRNIPVLDGETLEVRELSGGRAHVEEPVLREELAAAGVGEEDVRTVTDPRTGRATEVWVRWRYRESLLFSDEGRREYALERTGGRLLLGGAERGLAPPTGSTLRLSRYRAGGGGAGNVGKGAVSQLLGGALVQRVESVASAEGGADSEGVERLRYRGGAMLRHRRQALTAGDYEALAMEASSAVALARALPATHPTGRRAAGWVTLQIVPHSVEPRPAPSFQLREQVRRFVSLRAPAAVAERVAVLPPEYFPVGVEAAVSPLDPQLAGRMKETVEAALARFLHPLTGGPEGAGWPYGRDVHLSDVAAALEALEGVDFVESLALLLAGTPAGDRVAVPQNRIVAAGAIRITLSGGEA